MGPMEGVEHEDVEVPEKLRKTFPFLPKVVSCSVKGGAVSF